MSGNSEKTLGELAFERYLRSQGIEDFQFEAERPGKNKRPDYSFTRDREYLFDVKDFEYLPGETGGAYDPYRRIREKIDQGRAKFSEFAGWPCCLVLKNQPAAAVNLTMPELMLGAMLGNAGFTVPLKQGGTSKKKEESKPVFGDKGKMIRPNWKSPQNTKISALISLLCYDDSETTHPGVIVWENPFAETPFSRDLFRGDLDQRWGVTGDFIERVFAGDAIMRREA